MTEISTAPQTRERHSWLKEIPLTVRAWISHTLRPLNLLIAGTILGPLALSGHHLTDRFATADEVQRQALTALAGEIRSDLAGFMDTQGIPHLVAMQALERRYPRADLANIIHRLLAWQIETQKQTPNHAALAKAILDLEQEIENALAAIMLRHEKMGIAVPDDAHADEAIRHAVEIWSNTKSRLLIVGLMLFGGCAVWSAHHAEKKTRQHEKEQKRSVARKRESHEEMTHFIQIIAGMAHDMRTTLGQLTLITDPAYPPSPDGAKITHEAAQDLYALLCDLLDLAKAGQDGEIPLRESCVSIYDPIRNAIDLHSVALQRKKLGIKFTSAADAACFVDVDPQRIRQIMQNLINNATTHTPEGGTIHIHVTTKKNGDLGIAVRDSGRGIAPEEIPAIFKPFVTGDTAPDGSPVAHRAGLGLMFSRMLAEMHGGTLDVESAGRGHGSTFTLTLPAKRRKQSQLARAAE